MSLEKEITASSLVFQKVLLVVLSPVLLARRQGINNQYRDATYGQDKRKQEGIEGESGNKAPVGIKKTMGSKQRKNQTVGNLDRVNKLNK